MHLAPWDQGRQLLEGPGRSLRQSGSYYPDAIIPIVLGRRLAVLSAELTSG